MKQQRRCKMSAPVGLLVLAIGLRIVFSMELAATCRPLNGTLTGAPIVTFDGVSNSAACCRLCLLQYNGTSCQAWMVTPAGACQLYSSTESLVVRPGFDDAVVGRLISAQTHYGNPLLDTACLRGETAVTMVDPASRAAATVCSLPCNSSETCPHDSPEDYDNQEAAPVCIADPGGSQRRGCYIACSVDAECGGILTGGRCISGTCAFVDKGFPALLQQPRYIGCMTPPAGRTDPIFPFSYCSHNGTADGSCLPDPSNVNLSSTWAGDNSMTVRSCAAQCAGFIYAAIFNGNHCSCSDNLVGLSQVEEKLCWVPCSGDPTHACGGNAGGHYAASVYLVSTGVLRKQCPYGFITTASAGVGCRPCSCATCSLPCRGCLQVISGNAAASNGPLLLSPSTCVAPWLQKVLRLPGNTGLGCSALNVGMIVRETVPGFCDATADALNKQFANGAPAFSCGMYLGYIALFGPSDPTKACQLTDAINSQVRVLSLQPSTHSGSISA